MQVTRSGFYAWLRRGLSAGAQRDLVLRTKLRAFHAASGHRYGRPRLWKDLKEDGEHLSEERVGRRHSGPGSETVQADHLMEGKTRAHQGRKNGRLTQDFLFFVLGFALVIETPALRALTLFSPWPTVMTHRDTPIAGTPVPFEEFGVGPIRRRSERARRGQGSHDA
jgi:hypothetical protein